MRALPIVANAKASLLGNTLASDWVEAVGSVAKNSVLVSPSENLRAMYAVTRAAENEVPE